jgi:hypothetical protein
MTRRQALQVVDPRVMYDVVYNQASFACRRMALDYPFVVYLSYEPRTRHGYAVALHEFGHLALVHHTFVDEAGRYKQEEEAWGWALAHCLPEEFDNVATSAMACLLTYNPQNLD